jgi:hypothetical protein
MVFSFKDIIGTDIFFIKITKNNQSFVKIYIQNKNLVKLHKNL